MPEYLAPGVYVEEVSFRGKSIQAASTNIAGFVGPTPIGPSEPTPVTSWSEYEQVFGAGADHAGSFLPYAVRGFDENGGRKLYVARVVAVDGADAYRAFDFVGKVDDRSYQDTHNKLPFLNEQPSGGILLLATMMIGMTLPRRRLIDHGSDERVAVHAALTN